MKAVTEFANFTLSQALKTQAALTGEGKSPEEIEKSLSEAFKMEGDKLKHFISAMGVAGQNADSLKRVLVVSLADGETIPAKATKVEEFYYVPEFYIDKANQVQKKPNPKGGGRGGGGRGGDRSAKSSPWGLSPEEKAAKTGKAPKPS